ncbi:MAG: TolB family protein, partial [Pyrinomonadaceae bacterium]
MFSRRRTLSLIFLSSIGFVLFVTPATRSTSILRRITTTSEQSLNLNPSLTNDGTTIAFESTAGLAASDPRTSFHAIVAGVNVDGVTALELGRSRAIAPATSSDGHFISFASTEDLTGENSDRNSEIFLFNDSALIQVTHTAPSTAATRLDEGNDRPSMSDDGRFIAFASNENITGRNIDCNREIIIYDAPLGRFAQITNSVGIENADAKISGNGERIAFLRSHSDGSSDLLLYDRLSDVATTVVTNISGASYGVGRSLDRFGTRVVYSALDSLNQSQVYLYETRTGVSRQLTTLASRSSDVNLQPTISGDGKRVAFATRRKVLNSSDGSVELYVLDLPTNLVSQLTNAPARATAEV